jgi:hypothetical protein
MEQYRGNGKRGPLPKLSSLDRNCAGNTHHQWAIEEEGAMIPQQKGNDESMRRKRGKYKLNFEDGPR